MQVLRKIYFIFRLLQLYLDPLYVAQVQNQAALWEADVYNHLLIDALNRSWAVWPA